MKTAALAGLLYIFLFSAGCGYKDMSAENNKDSTAEISGTVSPSYCRITFEVIETYPDEKSTLSFVHSILSCGSGANPPLKKDTIKIYFPYSLEPSEENNYREVSAGDYFTGDIKRLKEKEYSINFYKKTETK